MENPSTGQKMPLLAFPKDFIWGTATASYQIEGAVQEDGRGESIWDRFSHTIGKVKGGDTGDVACDSYHRYPEDIAIMKQLHQKSCRFSVAWPRIFPEGKGAINPKGLDYYKRYVDALLEAGIRPSCTLYHWDLPQALQDQGGWANREMVKWFADYAAVVGRELRDRVKTFAIFNEPFIFTWLGHSLGIHAPGLQDDARLFKAMHVVNLAQGEAYRAVKAAAPESEVGGAYSMAPPFPAADRAEDRDALERMHAFNNVFFIEPALYGRYPTAYAPLEKLDFRPGDEKIMKADLDWIGINYYSRQKISGDPTAPLGGYRIVTAPEAPVTHFGWEIWPDGLRQIVTRIAADYKRPIEITENGCSYMDSPGADGQVHDARRLAYFKEHLKALLQAIDEGAPVRAYHAWSLLDNFEWAEGYAQRFGLVWVDFEDQRRIVKESGAWYGRVAATGRLDV